MKLYRWMLVAVVGMLCAGAVFKSLGEVAADVPTLAQIESLPVIVIDPGHGGVDGGAVSDDGAIVEKDINLSISLVLRDLFVASGFEVIMTRDTDISIHDDGVTGIKNQKTSDLHNRLAMAQENPNAVFLSIHQNKFGQASSRGTQVFHGPNNPDSEALAAILQDNFISQLQPENHRQYKKAGKNLYLMYEAECPAVLVECGFLSNPEESGMLTDAEYQAQMAFVIYGSVLEYLSPPPPAAAPTPAPPESTATVQDAEEE